MTSHRNAVVAQILVLATVATLGCEEPPVRLPLLPTAQVQVQDSAGIWVASNTGDAWSEADAWRVASRPVLRLGEATGREELMFYGLGDAARATDGRIAILNRGTYEVRIFSSRGRHLRSFGRQGDGPDEFQGPTRLEWLAGDSLLVWDRGRNRIAVFDGEGQFGRAIRLPADRPPMDTGHPRSIGWIFASIDGYEGGTVIARGGVWYIEERQGRWVRSHTELLEIGPEGVVASLGTFPLKTSYFNKNGEQPVHFGGEAGFATDGDRIYVTDPRTPEIKVLRRSGGLLGLIRTDIEPRPVTEADLEAFKAEKMESIRGSREGDSAGDRRWRELLDEIPARESMPVFSTLLTDRIGNMWVELHRPPSEPHPGWLVFRDDGQLLGRVSLPATEQVFEIGDTWILALEEDEDGVEQLVQYDLIKPR